MKLSDSGELRLEASDRTLHLREWHPQRRPLYRPLFEWLLPFHLSHRHSGWFWACRLWWLLRVLVVVVVVVVVVVEACWSL